MDRVEERTFRKLCQSSEPTAWFAAGDLLEEAGKSGEGWRTRGMILQGLHTLTRCEVAVLSGEERKGMHPNDRRVTTKISTFLFQMQFGITLHTLKVFQQSPERSIRGKLIGTFNFRHHLLTQPEQPKRDRYLKNRALDIAVAIERFNQGETFDKPVHPLVL